MKTISTKLILSFFFLVSLALLISGAIFFVSYTHTLRGSEYEALKSIAREISLYAVNNKNPHINNPQFHNFLSRISTLEEVSISIQDNEHRVVYSIIPEFNIDEDDYEDFIENYFEYFEEEFDRGLNDHLQFPPFEVLRQRFEFFSGRALLQMANEMRNSASRGRDNGDNSENREGGNNESNGVWTSRREQWEQKLPKDHGGWLPKRFVNISIQGDTGRPYTLTVYRSQGISNDFLRSAGRGFAISALFAIAASVLAGFFLGKRISRPIISLKDSALAMSEGNYSVRAPVESQDETADLAESFNILGSRLEQRIRELSEERDSLRNFLADASHELRTPLTTMLTSSEILAERLDLSDERLASLYSENHSSILRMKALVDHLLSLSRLQAGIQYMSFEQCNVSELARAAVELVQSQCEGLSSDGQCRFEIDVDEASFEADRLSFIQVFRNCFENSVKAGAQIVRVSAFEEGGQVCISVIDNGRGIDQEDIDKVSTRFFKGSESSGTGLGLAIVEGTVLAHNGSMQIFSPPESAPQQSGKGCEIRFTIPKKRAD